MSSRRYRVDQEIEIYNFRVVPDLQISKKVEILMIYMIFLHVFGAPGGVRWGPNWGPALVRHRSGTGDPKSAESV